MAHDHHHHDASSYYTEQLFTIAIAGALGMVACLLWYNNLLGLILHPKFHLWVVLGGAALLVLVVIRAAALWFSVAEPVAVPVHDHDHEHCDHDHTHDHGVTSRAAKTASTGVVTETQGKASTAVVEGAHTHSHAPPMAGHHHHDHEHNHEHNHEHTHDHEHGWAPWRYVVLLLPVVLYFLHLPNEGFSSQVRGLNFTGIKVDGSVVDQHKVTHVGFLELEAAAKSPEQRAFYQGKTVRLTGRYVGDDPTRFSLIRYKINCCAADAIPLNSLIMLDPKAEERLPYQQLRNKWVEVTGLIQFVQRPDNNEYVTALILRPTPEKPLSELIQEVPQDNNPYVY
jgi:hypothetical protein